MDSVTLWVIVIVLALMLFLALLAWYTWYTRPQPTRTIVDPVKTGTKRLSPRKLEQLTEGQFVELGLDTTTNQPAILPEEVRFMNSLVLGPTGSGKTSFIVATYLWRDIATMNNSVVVFDALGGLTESVIALATMYRRDVLVFPDCGFNPLGGAGSASDRAGRFADIYAQANEIMGGASDYYATISAQWIRSVMAVFHRAYPGSAMILRELFELATSEDRRTTLFQAAGVCPEMTDYLLQFESWGRQSEYSRNLSGLISFLSQLQSGSRGWLYNQRMAPTVEQAIEQHKVIIIREGGFRNTLDRTLGLLFMVSLQEYIRKRDVAASPHPVRIYLDEAHLYFNPNFPTLIATNRQKRAELILGFQALSQFAPYTDIVTTNARTWIILPGLLYDDAVYIAQNVGMRQIENVTVSHTPGAERGAVNHSRSLEYDYLIQPQRIRDMQEDRALVLSVEGRETKAPQIIKKPKPFALTLRPYETLPVPDYPPATIWDEQEHAVAPGQANQQPQLPSPETPGFAPATTPTPEDNPNQPIPFEERRQQRRQRRGPQPGNRPEPPGRSPDWD